MLEEVKKWFEQDGELKGFKMDWMPYGVFVDWE